MENKLSKREYFAAHAPECPKEFKYTPARPQPEELSYDAPDEYYKQHSKEAINELLNDYYDYEKEEWDSAATSKLITVGLKEAADAVIKWDGIKSMRDKEIREWEDENESEISRLIQWRYFYADLMIKEGRTC